ncbi:hypothetical protein FB446DRAFT_758522 [Lentinula raphanica]|nr:hypothetical protein FB446DRAFT_758522 [Lentinula raphanica]
MSIHLYQKRAQLEPVLNNVFQDDQGNTVYDVHTPQSLNIGHRTTTVSKYLRDAEGHDSFEYVAQIEWKVIQSSRIRFANGRLSGQEVKTKDYIRKDAWSFKRLRDHAFTGEDGKDYVWQYDNYHQKLFPKNDLEHPVAVYTRETLKEGGHLEVFPPATHLIEEIIVTFIYVENRYVDPTTAAMVAACEPKH